jgi:hypothetical protein
MEETNKDGIVSLSLNSKLYIVRSLKYHIEKFYVIKDIFNEGGAAGGMRICRGNRSTRRKRAPMPLCPPQIPHDLIWARTPAAAVGNRRLTALATTQSISSH